jgi:hypothetical protein
MRGYSLEQPHRNCCAAQKQAGGRVQIVAGLDLLQKYDCTFRKMVNSKVRSSDRSIKELLRLNSDADWEFLTAAMDIIGDTAAAISHFQRFGLGGPTKYDDLGEKYLRLYGLLSAIYIQQQAILTIYKLMNVTNLKQTRAAFEALQIRQLRHKLSAHGTDYLNKSGTTEAYVPLRLDLGDRTVTAVQYASSLRQEKTDLGAAIDAHARLMIDTMDKICAKTIKSLFKGHSKKVEEFTEELSDLRIEKSGGMVIKGGAEGAPKLIVAFVKPSMSE